VELWTVVDCATVVLKGRVWKWCGVLAASFFVDEGVSLAVSYLPVCDCGLADVDEKGYTGCQGAHYGYGDPS